MKPPAFEYAAPATVAEAVALLDERGFDAKVLAGGQSLMALLNMRLARPELLVDIARVSGLDSMAFQSSPSSSRMCSVHECRTRYSIRSGATRARSNLGSSASK